MEQNIFERETPRTLSQIVDSIIENEALIMGADGEITPELEPFIEKDEKALADKVDGYGDVIRDAQARAKVLADEIKRLQALKKTWENKAAGMKEFLKYNMEKIGTARIDGTRAKAYFSSSSSVEVDEDTVLSPYSEAIGRLQAKLPAWVELEIKVVKTPLAEALKGGRAVQGAAMVSKKTLVLK